MQNLLHMVCCLLVHWLRKFICTFQGTYEFVVNWLKFKYCLNVHLHYLWSLNLIMPQLSWETNHNIKLTVRKTSSCPKGKYLVVLKGLELVKSRYGCITYIAYSHSHTYTWLFCKSLIAQPKVDSINYKTQVIHCWSSSLGPDRNDDISKLIFRYLA